MVMCQCWWKCKTHWCYVILYDWAVECVFIWNKWVWQVNLHPRFKVYCRWHTEKRKPPWYSRKSFTPYNRLGSFWVIATVQYMLACSCEFLTFYLVFQEWFDFATAGLYQGSTKIYLKHIFSLFDTPHKADIYHCVSALSSHKLPVSKPLILVKRVQGCSL